MILVEVEASASVTEQLTKLMAVHRPGLWEEPSTWRLCMGVAGVER